MNPSLLADSRPAIPADVEQFAIEKGVSDYLEAVIDLARQAFPSSPLSLFVGRDAEHDSHRYIALDVEVGNRTTDELLAGQSVWSSGLGRVCPSHLAVHFVLGWQ